MQARMRKHLRRKEKNWFELACPRWYQTLAEIERRLQLLGQGTIFWKWKRELGLGQT